MCNVYDLRFIKRGFYFFRQVKYNANMVTRYLSNTSQILHCGALKKY